ncbi:MAG TPA: hypothetical protein VHC97_05065 [Thermoanaerobaculia bacterium]|nr:hypothetical protein [Thermoanaerobaculia bacterium]
MIGELRGQPPQDLFGPGEVVLRRVQIPAPPGHDSQRVQGFRDQQRPGRQLLPDGERLPQELPAGLELPLLRRLDPLIVDRLRGLQSLRCRRLAERRKGTQREGKENAETQETGELHDARTSWYGKVPYSPGTRCEVEGIAESYGRQ